MIHSLKTEPKYFEAVASGKKTFELRKNDRDFRVGDYLALNEWDGDYTGAAILAKITWAMNPNEIMTCQGDYVILSIEQIENYGGERGEPVP